MLRPSVRFLPEAGEEGKFAFTGRAKGGRQLRSPRTSRLAPSLRYAVIIELGLLHLAEQGQHEMFAGRGRS